jgi:hypothetical protein
MKMINNNIEKIPSIILTTALLIAAFALHAYMDKNQLYENIGEIVLLTNLAAYLIPILVFRKLYFRSNSFLKMTVEILVPSLISVVIYVFFICVFNIFNVPNFLENFPLYFIPLNILSQALYALVSALIAIVVYKIFNLYKTF